MSKSPARRRDINASASRLATTRLARHVGAVACWLLVVAGWRLADAQAQQTRVVVTEGQVLTGVELATGSFLGQGFELGPDLVVEVERGGVVGPLTNAIVQTNEFFDFAGSIVNVNSGGRLAGEVARTVYVENLRLNVFEGGQITTWLRASGGAVNLVGGTVTLGAQIRSGGVLTVRDGGDFGNATAVGSSVEIVDGGGRWLTLSGSVANITGGAIGLVEAGRSSTANVAGGMIDSFISAPGSTLNLTGGSIERVGELSGTLNASGGALGREYENRVGAATFTGGEFFVNGAPYTAPTVSLTGGNSVLTGTFADGSPFVFTRTQGDRLEGVQLVSTPLPELDMAPMFVDSSTQPGPNGLRRGQTLTLGSGGALPAVAAVVGATLNVEGGRVEHSVDAYQSTVRLRSGVIDRDFHLLGGSTFEMSGGKLEHFFQAYPNSTTTISGGRNSGGFYAQGGSTVTIVGGSIGNGFRNDPTADVSLIGGEFRLNGDPYNEERISLSGGDTFTGTLRDGSPFIFRLGNRSFDRLKDVKLIHESPPAVDLTPIVVGQIDSPTPVGLRAGQHLTLQGNGTLPENFEAVEATLNITGGTVGERLTLAGGEANITGGRVGDRFNALPGSTVNLAGGSIGSSFSAEPGSIVNLTGGRLGEVFRVGYGSVVNLSGGSIGPAIQVSDGASFNVFGGEFMVNGTPYTDEVVSGLDLRRDVFSGTLADGTTFVFAGRFPDPRLPDRIAQANLIDVPLPEIGTAPDVVDATSASPKGLRRGQTLVLEQGGVLQDDFAAIGGELTVNGGSVGANMQVVLADVAILGGTIESNLDVRVGGSVSVSGGVVKDLTAFDGGSVDVLDGQVGALAVSNGGSADVAGGKIDRILFLRNNTLWGVDGVLTISGGRIGQVIARDDSVFRLLGGSIDQLQASEGVVTLYASEFLIDGIPTTLQPMTPVAFRTEPTSLYTAVLRDGSRLEFSGHDVRSAVRLNVVLAPEPNAGSLLIAVVSAAVLRRHA